MTFWVNCDLYRIVMGSSPPLSAFMSIGEVVCLLLVCLSAGLRQNYQPDFHETWRRGVAWAKEELLTFCVFFPHTAR